MKFFVPSLLLLSVLVTSCEPSSKMKLNNEDIWCLGWRMIENEWQENYASAEIQFDSLLALNEAIDKQFLSHGLKVKYELSKTEEVVKIISGLPEETRSFICSSYFARELTPCLNQPREHIENKELQLEIIHLFVEDQAIRGNVMNDVISRYNIDTANLKTTYDRSNPDEIDVDKINRNRLKEIFSAVGFPTAKMIGKEAMSGVFIIIQHADGDSEWQKAQLPKREKAVRQGDLHSVNYAYLYDRIMVNSGEK